MTELKFSFGICLVMVLSWIFAWKNKSGHTHGGQAVMYQWVRKPTQTVMFYSTLQAMGRWIDSLRHIVSVCLTFVLCFFFKFSDIWDNYISIILYNYLVKTTDRWTNTFHTGFILGQTCSYFKIMLWTKWVTSGQEHNYVLCMFLTWEI